MNWRNLNELRQFIDCELMLRNMEANPYDSAINSNVSAINPYGTGANPKRLLTVPMYFSKHLYNFFLMSA